MHLWPLIISENKRFAEDFSRRASRMSGFALAQTAFGSSLKGNLDQKCSFGVSS
jgi:hypothetical protein